jgi:glyoxylase-like metal-dependent hydrolase (beta-lactamase superfamily II)
VRVDRIEGGPWKQNCFVVASDGEALIIDPGGNAQNIVDHLEREKLKLRAIVNTHGHYDHLGAVVALAARGDAPFFISGREAPIMRGANMLRFIFRSPEKVVVPDDYVDLDQLTGPLEVGGVSIECISTPGHTPGSHCFRIGEHLFTGDTILPRSPGNTRLPGGDEGALMNSLARLRELPPLTLVHPGHGRDMPLGEGLDAVAAQDRRSSRC